MGLHKNGGHVANDVLDIFKCEFSDENYLLIQISLQLVPNGPVSCVNISFGNGLAPSRCEAITRTNGGDCLSSLKLACVYSLWRGTYMRQSTT